MLGANIGRFRFRADYQYSSKKYGSGDKFEWTQTYAFTDIAAINSKLYVGELFSRSHIFDSVRFKGVSLFSDENMMPSFLQGYSPQITGTAVTNAIVTVTQYGQVLRTVQVPAGPFAISDIPTYVSGTVDVEIENDNGEHQIYQVDISHVPYLTRKGQFRYNANAGKLSPLVDDINIKTHFISVDGSFGLTNNTSLLGGVVTTTDNRYRAMSMGLGLNLEKFGAISFDVTQSESKNRNNESLKGNNYRINYAKRFGQTTTFNLSAYRSGNRSYQTLNGYINAQKSENLMGYLDKERFSISLSQTIPSLNANIYATVSKSSRWGGGNNTNYNISASRTIQEGMFQNTSVQLSVMKSRYDSGRSDHQVSFFLTIPLETENYARVQYSANYNKSKYMDHQATYYQDLWGGYASVGASAYHKRDFSGGIDYSLNASYNKETRYGRVTTTVDYSESGQQYTAGFDGSLTITKHGIATHPRVFNEGARLIIDAGASGVKITNSHNVSNIFGLVGVSNVPSYYYSTYVVDNDQLPENLEIQDSVFRVAVSDGAIAYRPTGAISGIQGLTVITLPDGTHPPFGAVVYRKGKISQEVGIVAEDGLTYLSGINRNAEFIVKWNKDYACKLSITSLNQEDLRNLTCNMEL